MHNFDLRKLLAEAGVALCEKGRTEQGNRELAMRLLDAEATLCREAEAASTGPKTTLAALKLRAGALLAKLEMTYDFRHNHIPGMMGALSDLASFVEDLKALETR